MTNLLKIQNQIKHADWPYILQSFFIYFVLIAAGKFLLPENSFYTYLTVTSVFFIIVTLFHIYRLQVEESEHLQYKYQCISELNTLLPIRSPLPPMTGWAATPELAITVLKHIRLKKPSLIVELGSGVTTLVSAYTLEKYYPEGEIISLDHDSEYATITRNELNHHELSKFVDIRTAPLKKTDVNGKRHKWYDTETCKFDKSIDLLIIDGPPVKTEAFARYPALPVLEKFLSNTCTIILHDTKRKEESDIVKKWLKEFPAFKTSVKRTDKGITILTRD